MFCKMKVMEKYDAHIVINTHYIKYIQNDPKLSDTF